MTVTVLYFAAARERAGVSREVIPLASPVQVGAFMEELFTLHPSLRALAPHLRVAVDQEFVSAERTVEPGSEVALIPPVSGGSATLFAVVDRPLRLEEVVGAVSDGAGGVVTFTGAVRGSTQGRAVVRLEYEAYAAMAAKKLAELGQEIGAKHGARVAIVHRVGVLVPGELAVVIAAAAPHRKEAFRACEETLEALKRDVPIWKKEVYADGEVWVGMGP